MEDGGSLGGLQELEGVAVKRNIIWTPCREVSLSYDT
jgi:hypothetical protein